MQRFQPLTDVCFPLEFLVAFFFRARLSVSIGSCDRWQLHGERMGCPQWKTVKLKVVSLHPGNADRTGLLDTDSHRPPSAEQLLQRIGQLKLDHAGPDPNGLIPNGRLGTLFQSVIL